MTRRVVLRLAALVVAVTIGTLIFASAAWGYHIRGATYAGTHSQGGTVDFDVSSDGQRVTRFKATNIPGDTCTVNETESFFPSSGGDINSHVFSESASGRGLDFLGEFHAKQQARGSFFYYDKGDAFSPGCLSSEISYTARTNASAAGSEECRDSKRYLRKQKKAVKRAKRALRRANSARAKRKAKRKLKKARRRLKLARRYVKQDC